MGEDHFSARATEVLGRSSIPSGPDIEFLSDAAIAVHRVTAIVIVIAILAHVAGALKHHLIDKDSTLLRMIGRA